MPGLINAHTHTPMTLFRGHVEGHTLFTMEGWYNTIRVLELEMEPDMLPGAVAVSCAEMIRTGTTCFADQYFWMDQIIPAKCDAAACERRWLMASLNWEKKKPAIGNWQPQPHSSMN